MKALKTPVNQLENMSSYLEEEKGTLEKSDEELVRKCIEQNTVVGRIVGKLMKIVATDFATTEVYISSDNPNCFLIEIAELAYFSKSLRQS